jgi:hypothetical protein
MLKSSPESKAREREEICNIYASRMSSKQLNIKGGSKVFTKGIRTEKLSADFKEIGFQCEQFTPSF